MKKNEKSLFIKDLEIKGVYFTGVIEKINFEVPKTK